MLIKTNKLPLLFTIVNLLFCSGLLGQQKDFQSWWECSIDKGLKNGIGLSGEVEQRFRNNSLQYDQTLLTVTGEYDVKDYLNVEAGIRTLLDQDQELNLNVRYRIHMDATGSYPLSRYIVSFRIRLQYGFKDFPSFDAVVQNNLASRYRLKVDHRLFGSRFGFFATTESWIPFSNGSTGLFKKVRFSAGAEYFLNFRSQFRFRYLVDTEFNVKNPMQFHILVLGYTYEL